MNKKIVRTAHKVGFALKKHSPEILMGLGAVGVVASSVMACKATLKAQEVVEQAKDDLNLIHDAIEVSTEEEYSVADQKKDTTVAYARAAFGFAKLYAPAVVLGGLSLGCMFASNNILRKRCGALAVAYATVDTAFKEYRSRVVDRFGERVDYELKNGVTTEKVERVVTDPETGKEKKIKEVVDVVDRDAISQYARLFDRYNLFWVDDAEQLENYFNAYQNYLNDLLITNGFVTLNEAYKYFGFEATEDGMVVGWIYDPDNNTDGDGYIEVQVKKVSFRDDNGLMDEGYLLDFNVDGNIYSKLKEIKKRK